MRAKGDSRAVRVGRGPGPYPRSHRADLRLLGWTRISEAVEEALPAGGFVGRKVGPACPPLVRLGAWQPPRPPDRGQGVARKRVRAQRGTAWPERRPPAPPITEVTAGGLPKEARRPRIMIRVPVRESAGCPIHLIACESRQYSSLPRIRVSVLPFLRITYWNLQARIRAAGGWPCQSE